MCLYLWLKVLASISLLRVVRRTMLTSEEADKWRPGERRRRAETPRQPRSSQTFVAGGELAMRPSNMGIRLAANASADPATSPLTVLPGVGATVQYSTQGGTGFFRNVDGGLPRDTEDASSQETSAALPARRPAALRRIDDEGNAVPGSQDAELAAQASTALNLEDESRESRRVQRSQRLPLADAETSPFIQEGKFC